MLKLIAALAGAFAFGAVMGLPQGTGQEFDPVDDASYMLAVEMVTARHCTPDEREPLMDIPAIDVAPDRERVEAYASILLHVFQRHFNETDMTDLSLDIAERHVCHELITEATAW